MYRLAGPRVAEMAKLAENSFRDVNITFTNELSVSDELCVDVWELISLANRHPRVNILQPGPGVGGHCIAVDPWFIVSSAPEQALLIRTAREINDKKRLWVIEKVHTKIADYLSTHPEKTTADLTIALYGLAFKPNIDDLRESPALKIAEELIQQHSGKVIVIEPNISELPLSINSAILSEVEHDIQSDFHVLLVNHNEFEKITPRMD